MESELAKYAEQQLIEAAKRMTPEQRLRAYIQHSKQLIAFQKVGAKLRAKSTAAAVVTGVRDGDKNGN